MANTYKKRILFVGMPDLALICLSAFYESNINVVGVIPPYEGSPSYNQMVNFAKNLDYNVYPYKNSLKDPDFLAEIKALDADIAVVCSYDKLFPKELLECTKDGFLNVHPSLLPEYRGANPYSHVIINGEKKTGVTIHFMDNAFDTGDIVVQTSFELDKNETMGTLFNKSNFLSANLLLETLEHYEKTGTLPRYKQSEGEYKKSPRIDISLKNNFINWGKSAIEIEQFIRALNPFIGAFTFYNGVLLKIHSARVDRKTYNVLEGTIVDTHRELKVACGDGSLILEVLQLGSYIIANSNDIIKRFDIKRGEVLNNG